jgi:hypothetical protein
VALARMGVWGKGRQSLAPPQHAVIPKREQRFGLKLKLSATSQWPNSPDRSTET